MHLVRLYYAWKDEGNPNAVPAGVIAIDLNGLEDKISGLNLEHREAVEVFCSGQGMFDDAGWKMGFTNETIDTIRNTPGGGFGFLAHSCILPDFVAEATIARAKADGIPLCCLRAVEQMIDGEAEADDE